MAERVEGTHFRKLFDPINIGRLVHSRIVMPAIHLSYTPQGFVTGRLVSHLALGNSLRRRGSPEGPPRLAGPGD